jgi:hypothetical protein
MQNGVPVPYEYTLESISFPALFRPTFTASPVEAAGGIYAASHVTRHPCTGPASTTSKRQSPDNLIPLDAPTQSRRYLTPSTTSRKDVPSFFNNKRRSSSVPSEGEEDELEEERSGVPVNDQEEIEKRRRKNTIAARKSRLRKLEQRIALQQAVERLTTEKEIWKTRALTLRSLLTSHGIPCPDFTD